MPAPTPYLDFEIEIGPGDGVTYPVAVLRSPAGEAKAELMWPFSELQTKNWLLTLLNPGVAISRGHITNLNASRPGTEAISKHMKLAIVIEDCPRVGIASIPFCYRAIGYNRIFTIWLQ